MSRTCGLSGCNLKYSAVIGYAAPARRWRGSRAPRVTIYAAICCVERSVAPSNASSRPHPSMQSVLAPAPLVAFCSAYLRRGLYVATAVLMAAAAVVLAVDWLRERRVPPMHALSAVLVL